MLTVFMPSRGREQQASEAYTAFLDTVALTNTNMVIVLDADEPGEYHMLPTVRVTHAGGMANALNAALRYGSNTQIFGFVGDDHFFRTPGWDDAVTKANAEMGGGIVYGNDLLRGEELPSQVFIDARIVRALGWMALPGAKHLFLDDTWLQLGHALGRIRYLPDVHIEHMHPTGGKSKWDDNYRRVNTDAMYQHDAGVYHAWMRDGIDADVEKVRAVLGD